MARLFANLSHKPHTRGQRTARVRWLEVYAGKPLAVVQGQPDRRTKTRSDGRADY